MALADAAFMVIYSSLVMLSYLDVLEMPLCLRILLCLSIHSSSIWPFVGFKLFFMCTRGCRLDIGEHFLLFSVENYTSMLGMKMRICIQVLGAFLVFLVDRSCSVGLVMFLILV